MKAWEMEKKIIENAVPVVLDEDEQTWGDMEDVEKSEDNKLKTMWKSNVPGSFAPERLIVGAVQSMENMGYDTESVLGLVEDGIKAWEGNDMINLNKITSRLLYELNRLPKDETSEYHKYTKYTTWDEYKKDVHFEGKTNYDVFKDEYSQKILNGWIAQICGGALGTALEGYNTENIKKTFGDIRFYVRKPNTYNDDITYELAFLKAFEEKGYFVESSDIGQEWAALIPSGWSAEDIALKNLKSGIFPPESGTFNNPYREWIGAQMRGAVCGMAAPGDAETASYLAWKDGVVSHANNGVIGEIFNAVMVSLAFVNCDVKSILEKSISMLPKMSEYHSVVSFAYDTCKESRSWETTWQKCEKKFEAYNWIHAYPNAAAEVVALWFGNGDFDETMHITAMEGQDVDCNAAQIGTVLGIIKKIDDKWIEPMGDELYTYVRGMKKLSIKNLSNATVKAVREACK